MRSHDLEDMFEEHDDDETMAWIYQRICAGQRPWMALGNFMNAWYGYATERRPDLVNEPPTQPKQDTMHARRWGAFCAASVEFLCERYSIPCSSWVYHPRYTLSEVWYGELEDLSPEILQQEAVRQRRVKTTPAPFTQRNIFCGNRLFQNKYEMAAWIEEAKAQGLTNRVEILRYAFTKEKSIHSR